VAKARLKSVGKIVPDIEVEVRDDEQRLVAAAPGEIWVRGPQVSGSYLGLGTTTDSEGWFPTRDRGWIDEAGYLFIEGRADDTIIRGGENIAPAEIEDVLVEYPGIREVAVVGIDDDAWGQRIVACVVPAPGASLDPNSIRQFARARLRGSRTPDDVVMLSELPYTPTGKLQRSQVVADLRSAANNPEGP
jgi:acyl-CoA synthetase (AMP-forming)/AMP-acid ligase II